MNAERKWTPGPWTAGVLSGEGPWAVGDADARLVCVMSAAPGPHNEANAHLIAAAPDMYEALAMLDKWFTPSGSSVRARWERIPPEECAAIVNATRAALSKAEGR